jgi:hypothetical protein
MSRPLIQYVHVHKQKQCWSVHNSRGCYQLKGLTILVPCETVHRPEKKDNPRFFIRCRGHLVVTGDTAQILPDLPQELL